MGWGPSPLNETWGTDLESLMLDIIAAKTCELSLWNVETDGVATSPTGEPLEQSFIMCYYFMVGLDARIGYNLERLRTGTKCCN